MSEESLFTAAELGMETGKRTERVEWGLRATTDTFLHRKGEVEPRPSEENARLIMAAIKRGENWGWRDSQMVCRTVVTYTSDWEVVE